MADLAAPVLDVRGLTTVFHTRQGEIHAVSAVSFALKQGEVLGVVGESG
jgi:peptide/nickel transport system ATP-binding protein/oligopeptide transport system ATP-binding protein